MAPDADKELMALYGLKTQRQKRRALEKDREKQLIQLNKKLHELRQKQAALPWVPLPEPYQNGWKRTFVLREDLRISPHAAFYEQLLTKINTVMYSRNKKFTRRVKRKYAGKKMDKEIPQSPRSFYPWEWRHPKLQLSEAERMLFHPQEFWEPKTKTVTVKYVFSEPWRFILKVSPHMITHMRMHDSELNSQISEINDCIERRHLRPAINRLIYGYGRYRRHTDEKAKYRSNWRNMSLHERVREEY